MATAKHGCSWRLSDMGAVSIPILLMLPNRAISSFPRPVGGKRSKDAAAFHSVWSWRSALQGCREGIVLVQSRRAAVLDKGGAVASLRRVGGALLAWFSCEAAVATERSVKAGAEMATAPLSVDCGQKRLADCGQRRGVVAKSVAHTLGRRGESGAFRSEALRDASPATAIGTRR